MKAPKNPQTRRKKKKKGRLHLIVMNKQSKLSDTFGRVCFERQPRVRNDFPQSTA